MAQLIVIVLSEKEKAHSQVFLTPQRRKKKESIRTPVLENIGGEMIGQIENQARRQTFAALVNQHTFIQQFACTRDHTHIMTFVVALLTDKFMKVGQYPSSADLTHSEIAKYRTTLGSSKYRELHRAIGLASHGVGIGSYVYLRRIFFEGLVEEAHSKALNGQDWDEESFRKMRMNEKITALNGFFLPSFFLTENTTMYSILSKGIHELSEEECLQYFKLMKIGIELILDEQLEEKK